MVNFTEMAMRMTKEGRMSDIVSREDEENIFAEGKRAASEESEAEQTVSRDYAPISKHSGQNAEQSRLESNIKGHAIGQPGYGHGMSVGKGKHLADYSVVNKGYLDLSGYVPGRQDSFDVFDMRPDAEQHSLKEDVNAFSGRISGSAKVLQQRDERIHDSRFEALERIGSGSEKQTDFEFSE